MTCLITISTTTRLLLHRAILFVAFTIHGSFKFYRKIELLVVVVVMLLFVSSVSWCLFSASLFGCHQEYNEGASSTKGTSGIRSGYRNQYKECNNFVCDRQQSRVASSGELFTQLHCSPLPVETTKAVCPSTADYEDQQQHRG